MHLREDPFVFTCLLKWKFKCELKNGMLCLRSRPLLSCQSAALDRGQHVIDFEAPMVFSNHAVNSKLFDAVYNRNVMNNVNNLSICMAALLT